MALVTPGENLFVEAALKVVQNEGLVFGSSCCGHMILDTRDVKTHTCGLIWKRKIKVTRIIATLRLRSESRSHLIIAYRRDDLKFVKRLAENISSASMTSVSYDLHNISHHLAAYEGCDSWHSNTHFLPAYSLS